MVRRESIKGRLGAGTDALFSSTADGLVMSNQFAGELGSRQDAGIPASQEDVVDADQETSVPVDQLGGKPVKPGDSVVAEQPADSPARQHTDEVVSRPGAKPASQRVRTAVRQQTSEPVGQDTGKSVDLVKATFYLTPELVMKLEEVRMARLRTGQRVDKSALVREALEQLAG